MAVSLTCRNRIAGLLIAVLTLASAGCGEFVRQSRSPSQVTIMALQGASGANPEELGNPVLSDVITNVTTPPPCSTTAPCSVWFNDLGEVTMSLILRDPGQPGLPSEPTAINQVTFTRYRVVFQRSDGRNTQGVDVPYAFDGATTFTVPIEGTVSAGFELVRNTAKQEAPLRALQASGLIITTLAEVTFFGRDQAGNDVQAAGTIQVNFGNFADPS
jgi:hypothetical protein